MIEFLIPRRPVSLQTRNRKNLQAWKDYVRNLAVQHWEQPVISGDTDLSLTLVYLCDDSPTDVDNIIKPIQDAMVGVIYEDDIQISDIDSHRRFLSDVIDMSALSHLLASAVISGSEAVYVKVGLAKELGEYL